LPSLAIRDFFPLQPFGLERREGAATFAARRGLGPKGAPACRAMSFDSSTTSVTYKGVEKRRPPACSDLRCFNTLRKNWLLTYNISTFGGDKREGAGVENYFFNSLLKRAGSLNAPAFTNISPIFIFSPLPFEIRAIYPANAT
jgi:hypothetical protein